MKFTVLRRPRTQALLDGKIEIARQSCRWFATADPLGWQLPASESSRDLASRELDGGEMSLSAFIQAKSRGAPIVALPIFLKRGFVARSVFCSADSSLDSPEQLAGKKVGLVGFTSSMGVWVRGTMQDSYGLKPSSVRWCALSGSSPHAEWLHIPAEFIGGKMPAWEELDGYSHDLDRREAFLLSLLDRGELDAVVSFNARIDCRSIRPLLDEAAIRSYAAKLALYPINHLFVVKEAVIKNSPVLVRALIRAFNEARVLWTQYLPEAEREIFEREREGLGYDPFLYASGNVEQNSLEAFAGYLARERLIPRKLKIGELIYAGA